MTKAREGYQDYLDEQNKKDGLVADHADAEDYHDRAKAKLNKDPIQEQAAADGPYGKLLPPDDSNEALGGGIKKRKRKFNDEN